MKYLISILLCGFALQAAEKAYLVKQRVLGTGAIELLSVEKSDQNVDRATLIKDTVEFIDEHESDHGSNAERYQEKLIPESQLTASQQMAIPMFSPQLEFNLPNLEVRPMFEQGPPKNRINLPILAEGYTLAEKEKFFADAARITKDLFGHKAFSSYRELFNVYAIFVSSNESGVTDLTRKDTAFGLYRSPAGSKRGIMPSNTRAMDRAFAAAPGADYPIVMVNDDFYGGLGGRYAITTRSHTSGSMVLRHELGHNFGRVGEEYDGGYVYEGANFSSNGDKPNWMHWIEGPVRKFESKFLQGSYLWKNMTNNDINVDFRFPGKDYVLDLKISSVGWSRPGEVITRLDGKELELKGLYTADRSFFFPKYFVELGSGRHRLNFQDVSKDGDNVFAFAMVYAQPKDLITDTGFVGSYAVFDVSRRQRGYRPTYETCIMRNMRSTEFCSVDKENMWRRFLSKVDIIDSYKIEALEDETTAITINRAINHHGKWTVEAYDKFGAKLFTKDFQPNFRVRKNVASLKVIFRTDEVRKYTNNFSQSISINPGN